MGVAAGTNRWRFRSKAKGAPISKTFATKKEASDYQKLISRQLNESGTRRREIVLTGSIQKHLESALDTGIDPGDLQAAAELWLSSTRGSEGKDLTLEEAVTQAFDCEHFKTRAKSTRNGYRSKWGRFVKHAGPARKLCSIGSRDIKGYLQGNTIPHHPFTPFW